MIVLYSVGSILALAVLLLLVLLVLPLEVVLSAGNEQKLAVGVRFFGLSFGQEESRNPFVRFLQNTLAHKKETAPEPSETSKTNATAMFKENVDLLLPLVNRLFYVLRRCRVSRCEVHSVSGGDNAAIRYGEICATVYPFVGYLQNAYRLRKKQTVLDIGWDYDRPDSGVDMTIAVRVRVMFLVAAALPLLMQFKKRKGDSV